MASFAALRPDRLIIKRQKDEAKMEKLVAGNLDQLRCEQKGMWEHKTAENIRKGVRSGFAAQLDAQREEAIGERRKRLSALLYEEKEVYEKVLINLISKTSLKNLY